ncbi:hypothetical protein GQ43DRAFT_415931 [Delitschia confertaspora ATCC 74209]|uniref:Dipeptidase n=1 Tax=Delitschia confertaspora ATCC 74209 TaxID=1513339 RepID=A0A9P4JLQ4_9PLEO|nr:hypothetical protein GQ43DRAFT_415931 [Delitschia confertaspora ATCC 74209]
MEEALNILSSVPLIDGHNDWPHLIRGFYDNQIETSRFDPDSDLVGHVDLKRLLKGKSGGIFLSAYVDCPAENKKNNFATEAHLEVLHDTLQQIDLIHRLVAKYSSSLSLAYTSSSILEIFRDGKIACMIGVEGLHQIGNSASIMRMYHKLGVRYINLTHNWANAYADSATAEAFHHGLSQAGREMICEMNRIGMLIDLSHSSDTTADDVFETSIAPVAFTHSSTYHLCPCPRNVTDNTLEKLKLNRGIIMISFVPAMTDCNASRASIAHVVDHIEYVAARIGYDHIGIGTDYDGMEKSVNGLEHVGRYPDLVARMLERGITRGNIEKIIGLNVIRVMGEVETVAETQRATAPVLEDSVKQLWNDDIRAYVRKVYPGRG